MIPDELVHCLTVLNQDIIDLIEKTESLHVRVTKLEASNTKLKTDDMLDRIKKLGAATGAPKAARPGAGRLVPKAQNTDAGFGKESREEI